MERLIALEFAPATDQPQLVHLKRDGEIVATFCVMGWLAISLPNLVFVSREDLTIEGLGMGRPYWNDDLPAWLPVLDPGAERQRIAAIMSAVREQHCLRALVLS
jgi:hypothetical protein